MRRRTRVQRLAAGRPLGERGVRVVLRRAAAEDLEPRVQLGQADRHPRKRRRSRLNGWGAVGTVEAAGGLAYAAGLDLARAIAERAGDDGLRRRVGRRGRRRRGLPAERRRPRAGRGRYPTGAVCSTCSRSGRQDLRRPVAEWVARPDDLPLLDARADARERLDPVDGAGTGLPLLRFATRCGPGSSMTPRRSSTRRRRAHGSGPRVESAAVDAAHPSSTWRRRSRTMTASTTPWPSRRAERGDRPLCRPLSAFGRPSRRHSSCS